MLRATVGKPAFGVRTFYRHPGRKVLYPAGRSVRAQRLTTCATRAMRLFGLEIQLVLLQVLLVVVVVPGTGTGRT